MALLQTTVFAETDLKIALSSLLRTFSPKIFPQGLAVVGIIEGTGFEGLSSTLNSDQ